MRYYRISLDSFLINLKKAQLASDNVKASTTSIGEINDKDTSDADVICRISADGKSGYMVSYEGELTSVYSLEKGRGDDIMVSAIEDGAHYLDCFDGYLVDFYKRHGFKERCRKPNWTEGGPNVIYMNR